MFQFVGSYMENKVTMAVSDFCASANEFSRDIGHPKSTSDFCQRVKEKVKKCITILIFNLKHVLFLFKCHYDLLYLSGAPF